MMNCRDRRVSIQNELISKYDKPVLSFCMNIPGPVKTNELIRKAFDSGKAELLKALSAHNITILHTEEFHEPSGDELIMALDAPAEDIKTLATEIEESHPLGRLFDMDVIGPTRYGCCQTFPGTRGHGHGFTFCLTPDTTFRGTY